MTSLHFTSLHCFTFGALAAAEFNFSWVSPLGPSWPPVSPYIHSEPFVEFVQGLLVEACVLILTSQCTGHSIDLEVLQCLLSPEK